MKEDIKVKADKTKEECVIFWNKFKIKIENNEPLPIQFGNYTDIEKIDYCNKMIYRIENQKVY